MRSLLHYLIGHDCSQQARGLHAHIGTGSESIVQIGVAGLNAGVLEATPIAQGWIQDLKWGGGGVHQMRV